MPKHRFQKHFTLAEARALLPALRQTFHELHEQRNHLRKAEQKLQASMEKTGGDLGGQTVNGLLNNYAAVDSGVNQLKSLGIQIKDFNRGLVDFPHILKGREVFLCWELEDDDIEFWHDIDAGYAGRERL